MIDHVFLTVTDLERSIEFYTAALAPLGITERTLRSSRCWAIDLLESWIAQAPTDPDKIREAEEDLQEFKCNMNANRAATGERLPYPDPQNSPPLSL